ncbi:MAG TPA: glycoside hydrolase family 99-like domain-containing protein [Casimicrobiaceae bacterium]|nr:glycoside hydrolase family 99-like domain-containing protein [Casimicrobiaceae bacterium]
MIAAAPRVVASVVRAIAFYLPQFHPIPENDRWWGKGFTEWTNVTRARPVFVGHHQPRLPADFGFYDLRVPETLEEQAAAARAHGIHGFCYHYYWFAGKRLLERPVETMRATGRPDFPYCFCWANENWTRRWDGADDEVLIAQRPSRADDERFIRDLLPHLRDPRYIRVDGRALILVYRVGMLPEPQATAAAWRAVCRSEGVGELYLCAAKTYDTGDPALYGFDALVDFPPHDTRVVTSNLAVDLINPDFKGSIYDYREHVREALERPEPAFVAHPAVMPGWDNTARRPELANIFIHATPEFYEVWLREVVDRVVARRPPEERLVFINAWNEWAEGAYLEPDRRFGRQYLEATRRALTGVPVGDGDRDRRSRDRLTFAA